MARYLKRGATYEATAPLNSDDPLLSDLENDGSGATPSTIILAAPDDSQWILGVNDSGALTTTELATPVAGAALTSITLTSADGTEWEVTVTNAGALTTTEVV
jgi:hypothetical protein